MPKQPKNLTALQERNYKAILYLAKVNPERYEVEYVDGNIKLTEFAQVDTFQGWKYPFTTYNLNTK